ncbi:MAG: hypothetical protein ABJM06_09160 [Gilvibacter sp.]
MSEYANLSSRSKKESKAKPKAKENGSSSGVYLEDKRTKSIVQAKLKEGDSNTNVVQTVGWESLGRFNPRRYIPEKFWGYTQEQMIENGLAQAPEPAADAAPGGVMPAPSADMPAPPPLETDSEEDVLVAPAAAMSAPLAAMSAPPPIESDSEEEAPAMPAPLKTKKKRRRNRKPKSKQSMAPPPSGMAAAGASSAGGGGSSSSSATWETVDTAGKKRAQRERSRQNRLDRAAFRAGFTGFLRRWVDKPDQDGTKNKYGTGSAAEHDLEARAKQNLRDMNPEGAIALLREAIELRRGGLGGEGSPGYQGHLDAIDFLEGLIRDIERLGT